MIKSVISGSGSSFGGSIIRNKQIIAVSILGDASAQDGAPYWEMDAIWNKYQSERNKSNRANDDLSCGWAPISVRLGQMKLS